MSRIAKRPVEIPKGVELSIDGRQVRAKGPKGQLELTLVDDVSATMTDDGVKVDPVGGSKFARSMSGTTRTLIANLVEGVSNGFTRKLELVGVGYRAQMKGSALNLQLGYSHDINFAIPDGIKVATPKPTEIEITGIDKQVVGQLAANIRKLRPPEPYKGKGVKYDDEYILRKEGKKK